MSRAVAAPAAFFFVAARAGGRRSMGVRQASSRAALAEALRREKLLLMNAWPLPAWASRTQTVTLADQAVLNEQLAQLLSRGVPLVEALDVAAQTVGPGARPVVTRMKEAVAAGASFSEACRRAGVFDEVTVAVYRAAERTGDLAGAGRQLAHTARRTLAVAGRAGTLIIYPAIVVTVSLVIAVLMLVFVVPRIGAVLADTGRIPWYTRLMMDTGNFLGAQWAPALLVLAAAILAVVVFRGVLAELVSSIARRSPMLGPVVLAQESARFFGVMAAMSRSGVPLADALGVAVQAITHPRLRGQMDRLRTRLVEGGVLRTLIEQVDALPLATRKLLVAAERAGDMESAFGTLAADMIEEVDRRSQRLLAALQPAMIIVMFLIIGSMVMALLIPLISLSGQMSGGGPPGGAR